MTTNTAREFLEALRAADRTVARERQKRLLGINLSEAQAQILLVVGETSPISLNDLSSILPIDAPPSRVVSKLVSRRLLSRRDKADDRRHIELTLTKAGKTKLQAVRRIESAVSRWAEQRMKRTPVASAHKALRALISEP